MMFFRLYLSLKGLSAYIRAKFRNVTKERFLPREHSERMQLSYSARSVVYAPIKGVRTYYQALVMLTPYIY